MTPDTPHNQCGSELARECVLSVEILFADTPLSRASSLPQGFVEPVKPSPVPAPTRPLPGV
ncbi:hypothetical protein DMX02_08870 [Pseudomonas jessenii]|nr:hypothetical protein DMX02_08870 [Pseudomonas jessenii]